MALNPWEFENRSDLQTSMRHTAKHIRVQRGCVWENGPYMGGMRERHRTGTTLNSGMWRIYTETQCPNVARVFCPHKFEVVAS